MAKEVVDVKVTQGGVRRRNAKKYKRPRPVRAVVVRPKKAVTRKRAQKTVKRMKTAKPFVAYGGSLASAALRITASIVDPKNHGAVRIPNEFKDRRTAICAPFEEIPQVNYTGQSNYGFILGRQVARQFIYSRNDSGSYNYVLQFGYIDSSGVGAKNGSFYPLSIGANGINRDVFALPAVRMDSSDTSAIHGASMFAFSCKKAPDYRFFFVNKGDVITATLTSTLSADLIITQMQFVDGMVTQTNNKIAATSLANSWTVSNPCYVAFGVSTTATITTQALSIAVSKSSSDSYSLAHLCAPDLINFVNALGAHTMVGSSVLMKNVTEELYKSGGAFVAQIPTDVDWTSIVYNGTNNPPSFAEVGSIQGVQKLSLKNGLYAYVKPDEEEDFCFKNMFTFRDGALMDSRTPLDEGKFVIAAFTSLSANSALFEYERTCSIEFETSDTSRNIAACSDRSEDTRTAMVLVKHMPQFMENPTHEKTILQSMKNTLMALPGLVKRYGPTVVKAASSLAKVGAIVATLL